MALREWNPLVIITKGQWCKALFVYIYSLNQVLNKQSTEYRLQTPWRPCDVTIDKGPYRSTLSVALTKHIYVYEQCTLVKIQKAKGIEIPASILLECITKYTYSNKCMRLLVPLAPLSSRTETCLIVRPLVRVQQYHPDHGTGGKINGSLLHT